ncbi:zinc finger protein 184-like [Anopheles nili]|uniref:zinc finger protein 184-like n=1 Tax=Anopheles nili TaxID=185578 RepID=UPI00237C1EAF|nr:zinc finger protein 184-like [Anopheles nili]
MDTQDLELAVSPEEMCRTCLAAVDKAQLKPIFCNEILDGRIVAFPSVLELTTGEKFVKNDKLPNNVCMECKGKLLDLYIFVGMVRKSSNLLYEIFSVEAPNSSKDTKFDTRHVEVQTEETNDSKDTLFNLHRAQTNDIETHSIGIQCEETFPMPVDTTEMSCQTDEQIQLTEQSQTNCELANDVDAINMAIMPTEENTNASLENDIVQVNSLEDGSLINDDDDEHGYEMILQAEETNGEAECFTLRPMKSDKKKLVLEISYGASKQQKLEEALSPGVKTEQIFCSYCNFTDSVEALEQHMQVHRETLELCIESIDYYRCSNCFTVSISQAHFEQHFNVSCKRVSFEEYVYHSDLHKHEAFYLNGMDICVPKLKTFKKIDNKYSCGSCVKFTSSCFDTMREHVQNHEANDDKAVDINLLWKNNHYDEVHVCGICQAQFPDATYIRQHLYFHQDSFFCIYECNVMFVSFLRMTRHFQRKHLQWPSCAKKSAVREGEHQCKQCGKILTNTDSLKNHLKNHFRPRKYVCTVCKKCFTQKSDLMIHCRIHTDERPYSCNLCSKKFRTTSHRRDHMFTHEVENKFECDICHKLFKAKRILAGHRRLHTGEKPHRCEICPKSFSRRQHLKLHQKTHDKPQSSNVKQIKRAG